MIKHPLFGKDSSPQYTAPRLGVIGTIIIWLIFFICGLFIPINKKPKYKTVQIVLETTPIEKPEPEIKEISTESKTQVAKTTSDPAPATTTPPEPIKTESPAESPKSEVTPMVETPTPKVETPKPTPAPVTPTKTEPTKKVETPKQAPVKKTETKKSEPAPKKAEVKKADPTPVKTETPKTESYTKAPEYQIKKSVEELMAEQAEARQAKSKSPDYDPWAQFDDTPTETVQETKAAPVQKQIAGSAALSGSAGTAAENKSSKSSTSSTTSNKTETTSASSNTTSTLGKIAATSYSSKSFDGTSESVALVKSTRSSSGQVSVAMDDGSSRGLIYPKNPVINISDENAKLIDSSKTVSISFRVLNAGNVPRATISITPSNLLPTAIQNEILDQVSDWRFEPSDTSSTAQFEFTILIK